MKVYLKQKLVGGAISYTRIEVKNLEALKDSLIERKILSIKPIIQSDYNSNIIEYNSYNANDLNDSLFLWLKDNDNEDKYLEITSTNFNFNFNNYFKKTS